MRNPKTIEADLMRAANVELLKFFWIEYYDSAVYNRMDSGKITEVGSRMNGREIELRRQGKLINSVGDCGTCYRPRQVCICDPDLV